MDEPERTIIRHLVIALKRRIPGCDPEGETVGDAAVLLMAEHWLSQGRDEELTGIRITQSHRGVFARFPFTDVNTCMYAESGDAYMAARKLLEPVDTFHRNLALMVLVNHFSSESES